MCTPSEYPLETMLPSIRNHFYAQCNPKTPLPNSKPNDPSYTCMMETDRESLPFIRFLVCCEQL